MDPQFLEAALAAGFTKEMAEFLWETFALDPHTHTADQVFTDDSESETLADVIEEVPE